jgi:hypothetical protein
MMPKEYVEMIEQARKDFNVLAKNDLAFSKAFIDGFAWGEAFVIAAQFHRDAEDVYEELVKED